MRSTSTQFLKPDENANEQDVRDGWLKKLKNKFNAQQLDYLSEEFENLDYITLPKMSYLAQEDFYKALKSLTIYELQVNCTTCMLLLI